jgi:hypothetical protein
MSFPSPNLDDRSFHELVEEARRRIALTCPEWTDHSPGDPGTVLVEVFAHLTEVMIYRLNRVPDKAYVEFLRLLGVRVQPPAAARVELRFVRSRPGDRPIEIPAGTRAAVARGSADGGAPSFVTARAAVIAAGEDTVDVLAFHCERVEAELAGHGTGQPGLSLTARRPPIVAPTDDGLDLVVGVEAAAEELDERVPAVNFQDRTFRIWREVENFTDLGPDAFVYVADRLAGTISFAPAARIPGADGQLTDQPIALAEVPTAGREIRLWYRRGGGLEGNVAADSITTLKDPVPGVEVTNPQPATGGRDAESLENALVRGPQELHSLRRAVTARDFELLALRSSGAVARARALTRSALWRFAAPGTVEVLLVPYIPEPERGGGQVTAARLVELQTAAAQEQIQRALDERRPLGTICQVNWARYKTVTVHARVVVHREEDPVAVRRRLRERLHLAINPLPTELSANGWRFGQALRASHVYDILLAEPGVNYAENVRMRVDAVPQANIVALAPDPTQPRTWYAASGDTLFRSVDHGDGWEPAGHFEGEVVQLVRSHPGRPGLLAVVTSTEGEEGSGLHISRDCGESWSPLGRTAFKIRDLGWLLREAAPVLLLATDVGLFEHSLRSETGPVQVLVDPGDQDLGFFAVAVSTDVRGGTTVAVAAQRTRGVYLSAEAGRSGSFRHSGLNGEDVRVLMVQYDGPRAFLWAGLAVPGNAEGKGAFSRELVGADATPARWNNFGRNWTGGSCRALVALGQTLLAATHRGGVTWIDLAKREPAWEAPAVDCGLPPRDVGRFQPVDALGADADSDVIMAGGSTGVYRSIDRGRTYGHVSSPEFRDTVTLPETWLFCSGDHELLVEAAGETERD